MDQQLTEQVKLELNEKGHGKFLFVKEETYIGEMVVSVTGDILTVYHTEVQPAYEGKGIAGQLLDAMVAYVRAHHMKVRPLCPYVLAKFKRHPDKYTDIWLKETVH